LSPSRANVFAPFVPLLFVVLRSAGFIGARLGLPDCEPLALLSLRCGAVLMVMAGVLLVVAHKVAGSGGPASAALLARK